MDERDILLQIAGEAAEDSPVPIQLLATKLDALQKLILNVGSALAGGGARGAWRSSVARACQLHFISANKGSLSIQARLAEPEPGLFAAEDLGVKALQSGLQVIQAVAAGDRDFVIRTLPDHRSRARVMVSAIELLPPEDSQHKFSIVTKDAHVDLLSGYRPLLLDNARPDGEILPETSTVTITGILYLIQVESGTRQIGILWNNRQIVCHYPSEYESIIRDFLPGSLVEVEGRGTFAEAGELKQIDELYDMRPVEIQPLFWRSVVWGGRQFALHETIQIQTEYRGGIWYHEYSPLNLCGYGESRRESIEAFREAFSHCYDYYAMEQDEHLTEDAKAIKREYLRIVKDVK